MKRFLFAVVAGVLLSGALAAFVGRLFGRKTTRASILTSVIAQWLGAYVVWTLVGGLAVHYGTLAVYEQSVFSVVALIGGFIHYRAALVLGRERAMPVFVGVQLAWLVIVLFENGAFGG